MTLWSSVFDLGEDESHATVLTPLPQEPGFGTGFNRLAASWLFPDETEPCVAAAVVNGLSLTVRDDHFGTVFMRTPLVAVPQPGHSWQLPMVVTGRVRVELHRVQGPMVRVAVNVLFGIGH